MMKILNKKFAKRKFLRAVKLFKFSTSVQPVQNTNLPKIVTIYPQNEIKILQRATREDLQFYGTFHEAIGPVLVLAQIFAIMPVIGIRSKDPSQLYFKWKSFRAIYSVISTIIVTISTFLTISWAFDNEVKLYKIVSIVFFLSNATIMMNFLILAKKWPKLMIEWRDVEVQLPQNHTKQQKSMLSRKLRIITFITLTLSLIEHLLSIITLIPRNCVVKEHPFKDFFIRHLPQFFYYMDYSPFKAIIGKLVNILLTFAWSYMDLFVMLISISLSTRFKQLNECLITAKGKTMPEEFWSTHRRNYRNLCTLCENIDDAISIITTISFSNNLFFICVQLLNSLNPLRSIAHGIYFWFSLLYLIGRTLAVSLYASDINSESKRPIEIFRSVPQESWCLEVKRFSNEVINDTIALSGMKFFYLTRGLLLSVAGTIVTYELVLIQFHEVGDTPDNINKC